MTEDSDKHSNSVSRAFSVAALGFRGCLVHAKVSPVMHACISKLPFTSLALLDKGASVHGHDGKGRTALHFAYDHGMTGVVEALLRHGADAASADVFGFLPEDGVQ